MNKQKPIAKPEKTNDLKILRNKKFIINKKTIEIPSNGLYNVIYNYYGNDNDGYETWAIFENKKNKLFVTIVYSWSYGDGDHTFCRWPQ